MMPVAFRQQNALFSLNVANRTFRLAQHFIALGSMQDLVEVRILKDVILCPSDVASHFYHCVDLYIISKRECTINQLIRSAKLK